MLVDNAEGVGYLLKDRVSNVEDFTAGDGEANRQRQTVTVVFCEVVGSTALGASTDRKGGIDG
jgi:class 3 adenylate cyclase